MTEKKIALAYVGPVVPDRAEYWNPAFSRAGNMFQLNLLWSLANAGLAPDLILAVQPIPAGKPVWVSGSTHTLAGIGTLRLIPFLNIKPWKQIWMGVYMSLALLAWTWKRRSAARILYTFNLNVPYAPFVLALARLTGSRVFASINDINEPGQTVPATLPWKFDFFLQKLCLPLYDGLVAVSRRIIDDFAPNVPHIFVEGGVRPESFSAEPATLAPVGERPFTAVCAGGMEPANGIQLLLECSRLLPADEFRLVIAGGGALAPLVQAAAAQDPRITYLGQLTFDKVLEVYRNADLLLNLRITKSIRTRYFFPSKLFEYMASGTPVLSTCTGPVKSDFGSILFLLDDETPQGLARELVRIKSLQPDLVRDVGQRARRYMLAEKTWQCQGRKIAAFLRSRPPLKESIETPNPVRNER